MQIASHKKDVIGQITSLKTDADNKFLMTYQAFEKQNL
jgi:hypothetical protein